jgi:hypothetical protein
MKRQATISSFFSKKVVDKKPKTTHEQPEKESPPALNPTKKPVALGQPPALSNTELQQLHAQFAEKFGSLDKERNQKRRQIDKLMTDIKNEQTVIPHQKFTPLETQVVELKAKYPNCLLLIEVGYKFRFFGEDAKVYSNQSIYTNCLIFFFLSFMIDRVSCLTYSQFYRPKFLCSKYTSASIKRTCAKVSDEYIPFHSDY